MPRTTPADVRRAHLLILLAVIGALHALAPGAAQAQTSYPNTLYVARNDPACTNSGSGTATQPFCAIKPAASRATAGQTVRVSAGTYNEQVVVANSGADGSPITFMAAPGETVTVTGGDYGFYMSAKRYVVVQGFNVTNTNSDGIVVKASSFITVRDNGVSYAGDPTSSGHAKGIRVEGSNDSVFTGNTVDHNSDYGIYLFSTSTRNRVSRNRVYANARQFERSASGIRLYSASGNTISGNVSFDNEDSGIELVTGSNNNVLASNVTYTNGDHGIDVTNRALGTSAVGNTVYDNVTAGINVEGGSTGAVVMNNIGVDNATSSPRTVGNIRVDTASVSGTTVDWNLVHMSAGGRNYEWGGLSYDTLVQMQVASGQEANGIEADPRWKSVPARDFRLLAGSRAIDSANSGATGQSSYDVSGGGRIDDPGTPNTGIGPRAYDDRGAYEHVPQDAPPVAALTVSPDAGITDLAVTADASASTDTDGRSPIASYSFDWGDGTATTGPQAEATADHTYHGAGTYTVTVTVTDTANLSSTATHTVTVTDDPPVARLSVTPSSGRIPLPVTADASASTDGDGTPIATYSFDWGDGSPATGPQQDATATHTYETEGTYTVTVTVEDTAGQTAQHSADVTPFGDNTPPSAALTVDPPSGTVDLDVNADASASTDSDGSVESYSFDFGDGTPHVGPQATPTAAHTYRAAGTYTVTVTVTDDGGASSTATSDVVVDDLAPAARLSVTPSSGVVPLSTTADASASTDPDGTPIASFEFDWGDGSPVQGPQTGGTASHTFLSAGTHNVTVTVADTAGNRSTETVPVVAKPNLVSNPGFESGLTGWNTSGSSSGIALTRVSGGHSGDWAARLANTNTTSGTCSLNDSPDTVKPTAAGRYAADVWVRADTPGATLKARWTEYSGSTNVGSTVVPVTLTTGWQKVSLAWTTVAPGSSLDLNVYVVGAAPGTCFYADDVTIYQP